MTGKNNNNFSKNTTITNYNRINLIIKNIRLNQRNVQCKQKRYLMLISCNYKK